MSSEMVAEMPTNTSVAVPKPDDIAAALDEARQNARLLRVSSSLFLREAKELIDADRVRNTAFTKDRSNFLLVSCENVCSALGEQATRPCYATVQVPIDPYPLYISIFKYKGMSCKAC